MSNDIDVDEPILCENCKSIRSVVICGLCNKEIPKKFNSSNFFFNMKMVWPPVNGGTAEVYEELCTECATKVFDSFKKVHDEIREENDILDEEITNE